MNEAKPEIDEDMRMMFEMNRIFLEGSISAFRRKVHHQYSTEASIILDFRKYTLQYFNVPGALNTPDNLNLVGPISLVFARLIREKYGTDETIDRIDAALLEKAYPEYAADLEKVNGLLKILAHMPGYDENDLTMSILNGLDFNWDVIRSKTMVLKIFFAVSMARLTRRIWKQ